MKIIMGILVVLVAMLTVGFIWQATRKDLTARDVAKALGMKHWRYRVPDSIKPNQLVTLQIATAQGVQEITGGIAGFKPGEIILIAIIPSVDGEQLAWSMTGMSASTNSHFPNNPLKGTSITLWKDVDEVGADGVLLKAVKSGSASWSATNPTEITLRVAVGDSP